MEIWKDVVWYEWLYQVSNIWRVKSLERLKKNHSKTQRVPEKIKSISDNWHWYKTVNLSKNNKDKTLYIHRLVWIAFIDNSENKPEINHKNWIREDNRLENLEWVTSKENDKHKFEVLWYKHPKWWKSKLSRKVNQYTLDWKFIKTHWWIREAERSLWYNTCTWIYKVCKWKLKHSLGFIWKYAK
jgi:hypothetical protein